MAAIKLLRVARTREHRPSTDLLPSSAVGVGNDVKKGVGQVAIVAEGVVPPTDGYVSEVPAIKEKQ